jgi:uncharacterized membrane protein YeaQ/YmgE (transglycosylase-associated protein family)
MSAKLVVILLIGAIVGGLADQIPQGLQYLAGQIARRTGFGLVGDIIIGIAGAFVATSLVPAIVGLFRLGSGIYLQEIFVSALGAVLVLVIMRLARGRPRAE